VPVSLWK
jgi:hypothetical protein